MADQEQLSVLLSLVDEFTGPMKGVTGALGDLQKKLIDTAATFASFEGAVKLFESSVSMADRIQDTNRALTTFTGSAAAAAQAMKVFEDAQLHTRSTALELADLYIRVLPIGIRQGWSQGVLQQITVGLDQLAAKAMVAPEEMMRGFDQILMGRVTARNPLLQILGLMPDDIKKATDAGQLLFDKITAMAGDVPDSFASMTKKIKEELEQSLGQGFLSTFGQGSEAMREFKREFTDASFLTALQQIGKAIAEITIGLTILPKAVAGWLVSGNAVIDWVGQHVGAVANRYSTNDLGLNSGAAAAADAMIASLRARSGRGTNPAGTLYGQQSGTGSATYYDPFASPSWEGGSDPMAGGIGHAGKATQAIATNADNARAALEKLLQLFKDQAPYVTFDAFVAKNLRSILDVTTGAESYGIKLNALAGQLQNAATWQDIFTKSLDKLPTAAKGSASFTDIVAGSVFSPVLGGFVNVRSGTIDPGLTQTLVQQMGAFTQDETLRQIKYYTTQQIAAAQQVGRVYQQYVIDPLASAFADVATTGGKNIGSIFGQALASMTKEVGDNLVRQLTNVLGKAFSGVGGAITADGTGGRFFYNGVSYPDYQTAQQQQQNSGAGVMSQAGAGAIGVAGFALNRQNMSPLSGAISGFGIGQSLGGAVGGLVSADALAAVGGAAGAALAGGLIGAFVGAVVIAIGQATPTIATYAAPMVKDGKAMLTSIVGSMALTPPEQADLLMKIQQSFDQFRNGYIQVFLGLAPDIQAKVLPQLTTIVRGMMTGQLTGNNAGPGGTSVDGNGQPMMIWDPATNSWKTNPLYGTPGAGGNSGATASRYTPGSLTFPSPNTGTGGTTAAPGAFPTAAQVQQWWTEWYTNQLPQAVMEGFRPAFQTGFTAMGVTIDKFKQIWTQAESMSPQEALKYLGGYMTALGTLQDMIKKLSDPVAFGSGGGIYGVVNAQMNQSFVTSLRDGTQNILQMATGLTLLTGQSQIDQITKINTALTNRYQLEQQYIQQLIQMVQSAKDTLAGDLLSLQLAGKTPQQQYAILAGNVRTLGGQLGTETTAAGLNTDYQRYRSEVLQMASMFPNDPKIQAWAAAQLTRAEGIYEAAITRFGNAIDQSNQALTSGLGPALALLTTDTTQFGVDLTAASSSVSGLDAAAKSAGASVLAFGAALDSVTTAIGNAGYTASVKRSRAA